MSTVFCTTAEGTRTCKRLCANPPATPTVDAFLCPPGERLQSLDCNLQGARSCTYVCVQRESLP